MPRADRTVAPISLVIRWPNSVPAATANLLAKRLLDARLASTWAVEEPAQAGVLQAQSRNHAEISTALMVGASADLASAIDGGLNAFQHVGLPLAGIQVDASLSRGSVERRLCQSGIRAVVTGPARGKSSQVRPLPFGLWEFGPHVIVPPRRRLLGLRSQSLHRLVNVAEPSPSVASIDMARISATSSSSWRSVDMLIQEAAESATTGAARIVSIADIAAELSEIAAPRPQRSILRAAA